jgi:hypothetical protein
VVNVYLVLSNAACVEERPKSQCTTETELFCTLNQSIHKSAILMLMRGTQLLPTSYQNACCHAGATRPVTNFRIGDYSTTEHGRSAY